MAEVNNDENLENLPGNEAAEKGSLAGADGKAVPDDQAPDKVKTMDPKEADAQRAAAADWNDRVVKEQRDRGIDKYQEGVGEPGKRP